MFPSLAAFPCGFPPSEEREKKERCDRRGNMDLDKWDVLFSESWCEAMSVCDHGGSAGAAISWILELWRLSCFGVCPHTNCPQERFNSFTGSWSWLNLSAPSHNQTRFSTEHGGAAIKSQSQSNSFNLYFTTVCQWHTVGPTGDWSLSPVWQVLLVQESSFYLFAVSMVDLLKLNGLAKEWHKVLAGWPGEGLNDSLEWMTLCMLVAAP